MAGESGAAAGARRAPPGRAPELRLSAACAALAAGRRVGAAAEVLAGAAAPAGLRGARAGDTAGQGRLLRVRRGLGPRDPTRVLRARGWRAGAGRHPPE